MGFEPPTCRSGVRHATVAPCPQGYQQDQGTPRWGGPRLQHQVVKSTIFSTHCGTCIPICFASRALCAGGSASLPAHRGDRFSLSMVLLLSQDFVLVCTSSWKTARMLSRNGGSKNPTHDLTIMTPVRYELIHRQMRRGEATPSAPRNALRQEGADSESTRKREAFCVALRHAPDKWKSACVELSRAPHPPTTSLSSSKGAIAIHCLYVSDKKQASFGGGREVLN